MIGLLNKIIGDSNQKAINKTRPVVAEVNALEAEFKALSDEGLRSVTDELRSRLASGESLDDVLPEAFAAVREAARRVLGMRHFDVQLIGGVVLHQGKIAEMRTGEGKTLVATLPAYLNSLTGDGVHIVTVNDYLAKRDASWMGAVYHALGITVGCLQNQGSFVYDPDAVNAGQAEEKDDDGSASFAAVAGENMRSASKRDAYQADITYGTNNEFGFDYLRDNIVEEESRMVQKEACYAIVDEVDNILIDEARTPLIISGPARESGQEYRRFAQMAKRLERGTHYQIDEKLKSISLTPEGISTLEKKLEVENLYDSRHEALTHFVENAVRAEALYQRDREYVVRDNEVVIVDEFTGRLMEGRRYSDGLHQAIEAKENVRVRRESVTYATITLQNYFRLYEKLSGMTGTAVTEAEEFFKIYKLEVVEIPTNQEMIRADRADLIYKTEEAKWNAVAEKITDLHRDSRPVLVGTTSIEKSELLSSKLRKHKVPHQVLNAKQHEKEATVVAQAGRPGAVTVATNMAGRGTDIILGGNPDTLKIPHDEWQSDHDLVLSKGGLFVLGTERHEARRIDNQLRGRSGRQGDPGETQFYVSTEDDLIRRFGGDRMRGAMNMFGWEDDVPLENRMVSRTVESAQSKVEGHHFEIRKHLVDYDDVINTHRDVIYKLRGKVLKGEDLRPTITEYVQKELSARMTAHLKGDSSTWDTVEFQRAVQGVIPVPEALEDPEELASLELESIESALFRQVDTLYALREFEFGAEAMRGLERAIMLRSIDSQWVEHLTAMENMRQGIGLQAAGQRDPLVQYKRQSYEMFNGLMASIESEVARTIFKVALSRPELRTPVPSGRIRGRNGASQGTNGRATSVLTGGKSVMSTVNQSHGAGGGGEGPKVGRNQRCPCGSGKKYKRCHGRG